MREISLWYIALALLVFGFLIFIHELGHYIAARRFGVTIHEFSIGMGPKLFTKVSKKTGIAYSIRILPIGGFVSMEGEDTESEDENAFHKKAVWKRIIITAAGAFMNIVIGILVMVILVATQEGLLSNKIAQLPVDENGINYCAEGGLRRHPGTAEAECCLAILDRRRSGCADPARTVHRPDPSDPMQSIPAQNFLVGVIP